MSSALPTGRVIALLGAEDSGKAALAEALSQRLAQRGIAAALVVDRSLECARDAPALEAYRDARILLVASATPTPTDDALRSALTGAKLHFAVVHGEGAEQLDNAWRAIGGPVEPGPRGDAASEGPAKWAWACDKCSDPACEHRLFTELVAQRR